MINPTNLDGLTETEIITAITGAAEEWDSWTSAELFDDWTENDYIYSINYGVQADTVEPDGANEIVFGDIPDVGAIAVCIVWGRFGGPPSQRQIVEFDIIFDDADFTWGNADNDPTVMDLQNIATHEIGHGIGLADLYDTQWITQTMYGYASTGETDKRTLDTGDQAGIQALYGE